MDSVGSEYVDGYESTVFAKEDVYVSSNGTISSNLSRRYKQAVETSMLHDISQ